MLNSAGPRPRARTDEIRRALPLLAFGLLIAGMLALTLLPMLAVVGRGFFPDGSPSGTLIVDTLRIPQLATVLTNTVIAVVLSGFLSLVVGSVFAWLNERTDARMGIVTELFPLIPFLLAPVAGAVAWVLLLSPGSGYVNVLLRDALGVLGLSVDQGPLDIYSWPGLIFVYTIYQVPYAFLLVGAGLRNLDPALEEQARIAGTGALRTLVRVTLPAVAPSLMGAVLLIVWSTLALYSVPAVIGTGADIKVLTVLIVEQITGGAVARQDLAVGLSLIMIALVGVVFSLQRLVLRRGHHVSISGRARASTPIELGRLRPVARGVMIAYAAATTVLPAAALLRVALSGYWTPEFDASALSFAAFAQTLGGRSTSLAALQNSLLLGVACAAIGVAVALVLSYGFTRGGRWFGIVDGAIRLPATLSHVVLAVGFILLFAGPPFSLGGTAVILGIAYLGLYYPQAVVSVEDSLSQVGKELPEASRVAGASEPATLRRIFIPLVIPGMIAGGSLLFVRVFGDLTASSILSGPRNQVVGRQILDIFTGGSYAQLGALATVATVICTVVIVVATIVSRRSVSWSRHRHTSTRTVDP